MRIAFKIKCVISQSFFFLNFILIIANHLYPKLKAMFSTAHHVPDFLLDSSHKSDVFTEANMLCICLTTSFLYCPTKTHFLCYFAEPDTSTMEHYSNQCIYEKVWFSSSAMSLGWNWLPSCIFVVCSLMNLFRALWKITKISKGELGECSPNVWTYYWKMLLIKLKLCDAWIKKKCH